MPKESIAPVDESVHVPDSVKRAAALAESYYKPDPAAASVASVVDPATLPPGNEPPKAGDQPIHIVAAPAEVPVQVQPVTPQPVSAPVEPTPQPDNWEHRYLSMKGRYDQAQQTIGSMQEQMQELGNELVKTQEIAQRGQQATPQNQPQPPVTKLITDEDRKNYGDDLLDVTRRAALEAVSPQLTALHQENQQLRQATTRQAMQNMYNALDGELANWREVNVSDRFKSWLRLRDVYSGAVRQNLLNSAVQAANAPRVLEFFKGFLREEQATGQQPVSPQSAVDTSTPRVAATTLDMLAAPGRARPATGDTQVPVDKPTFTRAQISGFYRQVNQGVYAGRQADKDALEAQIFAAQREGRVR